MGILAVRCVRQAPCPSPAQELPDNKAGGNGLLIGCNGPVWQGATQPKGGEVAAGSVPLVPPTENAATPLAASAAIRLSQWGEPGVIARIFELVPPKTLWCVEFGAWDGTANSNTRALMEQGRSGVHIEADKHRFTELQRTLLQQ